MTTELRRRNISGAAIDDIAVHEGLRSYMLQVYNYMSSGLLLSGIVAMLVANTSLGAMFYQFNEAGRIAGYTGLGLLSMFFPLGLIFFMSFNLRVIKASSTVYSTLSTDSFIYCRLEFSN